MKIWLICAYGPIPGEGWSDYRNTMIAEALVDAGHDVTWWTSSFSHHFKSFRSKQWEDRVVGTGFLIRLVPGFRYTRNVSLARFWNELLFAWRVYWRARQEAGPDLIIAADPPPTIGRMAVWLARRFKCPLIFDVMDLWPELFALALPKRLRTWGPLIFSPLFALRRRNHAQADGLVAICESYRKQMAALIPARKQVPSVTIFNGIDLAEFRSAMTEPLDRVDLPPRVEGEVRAIFSGSLGVNYDVTTLMKAAEILEKNSVPIQILIAGVGPLLSELKNFIRDRQLKSLVYVGRLSQRQLPALYGQCDIGISAYGPVSTVGMPVKVYDYLAAGLPIVNSLRGELADILESRQIGLPYEAGEPASLADALQKLTIDETLRTSMARRSFAAAAEFDRKTQYGALPELLQRAFQNYTETHRSIPASDSEAPSHL